MFGLGEKPQEVIKAAVADLNFNVMVALCAHRDIKAQAFHSLRLLLNCPAPKFELFTCVGDALIDRSRGIAATRFLDDKRFEYLFFIDDDIVYNPLDVRAMLGAMKANNLDICGGAYCIKGEDQKKFAIKMLDNETLTFGVGGGIHEVRYISTGFMAIHRRVFEKMVAKNVVARCHQRNKEADFYPFFATMNWKIKDGQGHNDLYYLSEDWAFPLALDTKILTADFQQKDLRDCEVGDKLIGFDENKTRNGNRGLCETVITDIIKHKLPTTTLTFENQEQVTTTDTHKWLVKRQWRQSGNKKLGLNVDWDFMQTSDIRVGDYIAKISDNSKNADLLNKDFMVGYLQGVWDGDGTIYEKKYQHYARLEQVDTEAIERVAEYLEIFDIKYLKPQKPRQLKNLKWKPLYCIHVGRIAEFRKFIEILRDRNRDSYEYKCGYLSGIFDAEGCNTKKILHISNYDATIRMRVQKFLDDVGICGSVMASDRVYIRRLEDIVRFFTITQPAIRRKIHLAKRYFTYKYSKVCEISEKEEPQEVWCLSTDSHTFFANGLASHNCQRAASLGFKIHCDTSIKLGHIGYKTYDWDDFPRPDKTIEQTILYGEPKA